jgi:putative ABC transport system permease protein
MGADPGVIGKKLRLNGEPFEVVGVLPANFSFDYPTLRIAEPVDIYVPYPVDIARLRQAGVEQGRSAIANGVRILARIRPSSNQAEAAAELRTIASSVYLPEFRPPGALADRTFEVQSLQEAIVEGQRSLLWLLLLATGVLLLIACANTAQLLLAQSLRRGKEIAIRAALGATRLRLIRELLTEGIVLAAFGGTIGIVTSASLVRLLVRVLPVRSPMLESARLDLRVLGFTVVLCATSAIVFSVVPAIKGSMWTLGPALTSRTAIGQGNRWRHVMVAVEAALSVFMLCGAGLIGANLCALISTPTGFDPRQLLVLQLRLPPQRDQAYQRSQEYLARIRAIPGVDAVAAAHAIPLRPGNGGFLMMVGETPEALSNRRPTWGYFVTPDYFRVLGIPLLSGRTFRDDDTLGRPQVAVVNQEFLRNQRIEGDPIGRQIDDGPGGRITIVGVVADVRVRGPQTKQEPQMYTPYLQYFQPLIYVLVRSSMEPAQLIGRVKAAIRSSNAEQAIFNISTMDDVFSNSIATPRFNASLVGAFALLAVAMAASGMYSVISCLVLQRNNEIAVRIALGARPRAIATTVLVSTMTWVVSGLVAGLALGVAASRIILSLSGSVISASAGTYVVVVSSFVVVTLLAVYLPVRRATHVDPALALRSE